MNSNNADRINEYRAFLSFSDFVEDDDRIYFANTNYNALTIVDRKTWAVETLLPFEGSARTDQNMHLHCVKVRNKICFLPAETSCVHIYDTESGTQQTCRFLEETDVPRRPWEYCVCDDQVYLLPGTACQGMWHWNVETDAIEREDWWKISAEGNVLQHGTMSEGAFYTLETDTDRLYVTDVGNKTIESFTLPDKKVSHIAYDCEEQNFWYVSQERQEIVCWNCVEGVVQRYETPYDESYEKGIITYLRIYFTFGCLFLLSSGGDVLYSLDQCSGEFKKIHAVKCCRGNFFAEDMKPYFKETEYGLLCMLQNAGDIISIDRDTLRVEQLGEKFVLADRFGEVTYRILSDRNALLFEEKGVADLDMLIKYCGEGAE